MSFLISNFFLYFSQVLPIYLYLVVMFLCFFNVLVTRIHWPDRRIVRKQLDIMPTHYYVQNQGKLMTQSPKNGHKPQFGQFFYDFEVKYLQIVNFSEKRFHSNWRSYLVLTSRQKPKKSLEPFLRKIWKCLHFGLIWRSFREYLQIEDFFQKSGPVAFLPFSPLTSCKKSEKPLDTFLRKLHYQPTNQPTNQVLLILG